MPVLSRPFPAAVQASTRSTYGLSDEPRVRLQCLIARPAWEVAFAHAAGDNALHAEHDAKAKAAGDTLGEDDKSIFDATFRRIPPP